MNTTRRISPFQLFSIMILSRTVALFTFVLPSASIMPVFDRALSSVVIILFEAFYSAFIFFVLTKSGGEGIISYISGASPAAAKICSLIYALGFIWFAGISISRFEIFISTVMFPNAQLQLMALLLITTAVAAAIKGIEALGRTSVIVFTVLFISIFLVTVSVLGTFKYTNLKPPFSVGLVNQLRFAGFISVRSAELPAILIVAPHIRGNIKKSVVSLIMFFGFASLILLTVLSGVTGEFGDNQLFRLYTLTTIAKVGILERMDDMLISLWVLCAMVKTAYFLLVSLLAVKQGFNLGGGKALCCLLALGIFAVYKLSSGTLITFTRFAGSPVMGGLYLTLTAAVPVFAAVINCSKKRRLRV